MLYSQIPVQCEVPLVPYVSSDSCQYVFNRLRRVVVSDVETVHQALVHFRAETTPEKAELLGKRQVGESRQRSIVSPSVESSRKIMIHPF